MSNPVFCFFRDHPELSSGAHLKALGTGLIALSRRSLGVALKIAVSIMEGSHFFSKHIMPALCYIQDSVDRGRVTPLVSMFDKTFSEYQNKPAGKDNIIEWIDLYDHRIALSRLVETACYKSRIGGRVDPVGKRRLRRTGCNRKLVFEKCTHTDSCTCYTFRQHETHPFY